MRASVARLLIFSTLFLWAPLAWYGVVVLGTPDLGDEALDANQVGQLWFDAALFSALLTLVGTRLSIDWISWLQKISKDPEP